jgi:hypothetical protein
MDFSDEHYVKFYTRRTVTRELWPWQARALHPNLLLVVDKAGILDIGTRDPVRSVAVMVGMPADVVEPGFKALLDDGTIEFHDGKLVMPKFVEAQEAKKTKAAAMRDHREKKRDLARAKAAGLLPPTVTADDDALPDAIDCNPPAQPSPAQTQSSARPRPLPDPRSGSAGRTPSWQQDAHAQFLRLRAARLAEVGLTTDDEPHDVPYINTKLKPVLDALGGPDAPDVELRFSKLVSAWLDKASPASAEPPYPFRMFSSQKVWPELLDKLRGAA